MFKTLVVTFILILIGIALLSVGIWLKRDGKFPNMHVGSNPLMKKRGIGCIQTQDAQAQIENKIAVAEKQGNINTKVN
ncbi:MAG TPA: hypothetical protein VFC94_01465 [Bacteroidaceae bacterium]|nr:hypothetical protein [Bacteroidaceae bacterium]